MDMFMVSMATIIDPTGFIQQKTALYVPFFYGRVW